MLCKRDGEPTEALPVNRNERILSMNGRCQGDEEADSRDWSDSGRSFCMSKSGIKLGTAITQAKSNAS